MTIAKSPSHRANALVAHFACYYCDILKEGQGRGKAKNKNKNKTNVNSTRRLPRRNADHAQKSCHFYERLAQENENSNIRRHSTGMKTCTHTQPQSALCFAPPPLSVNLHLLVTVKSPSLASLGWWMCVSSLKLLNPRPIVK